MLSIQDLNKIKLEFLEAYEELFTQCYGPLEIALLLKLKAT